MTLDEFFTALEKDRTPFRAHRLGAPLADAELRSWQARNPTVTLPADLVALLRRANGIHPCASGDEELGQLGLAPLQEWTLLGGKWLLLTYDLDGRRGMGLEPGSGDFVDLDLAGRRAIDVWGASIEQLLEWLTVQAVNPLPPHEGLGSGLFYAGTSEEIRLGDRVRIRRAQQPDAEGVVCYLPGAGPRHPDLEFNGTHHWAVRLADGGLLQQLYAPAKHQPMDDLSLVSRGDTESLSPSLRLG